MLPPRLPDIFTFSKRIAYWLVFIILGILFITNTSFAFQNISRNQTIIAYLSNFIKYTYWQGFPENQRLKLTVLTSDEELIRDFKRFGKVLYKNDVNIKIGFQDDLNDSIINSNVVFISKDKIDLVPMIYSKVLGKQLLVVTENCTDQRLVMINLFDTLNTKLRFEVNMANIISQNLKIDNELLLEGGSLIDIAQLYRESQQNQAKMKIIIDKYNSKLDSLNKFIFKANQQIVDLKKSINEQKEQLKTQNDQLKESSNQIIEQINTLESQKNYLTMQRDSIKRQSDRLYKLENDLVKQYTNIESGNALLENQQTELIRLNEEIENKSKLLNQKNQLVNMFIVITFFGLALFLVIYLTYKNNKNKNQKLKEQKDKIEHYYRELSFTHDELFKTNTALNEKNSLLESALSKLKDAQNQLVQSEKMASIGILTAGIAHEMNNPVNFIYAGANCLKKDFQDILPILLEMKYLNPGINTPEMIVSKLMQLKEEYLFEDAFYNIEQTIEDILFGSKRIAEIIKGLRNFSRIDKEEWIEADVHELINDALVILKNKYKHHVEILLDLNVSNPIIECLPGKLNQVILNILSNAIDAIESKGEILIYTTIHNGMFVLSIKDNGSGMDDSVKSRIFDPFFTTKTVGQGMGLGLSISYGIIKEHRGTINVESQAGVGTMFKIELPVKQKLVENSQVISMN